MRFNEALWCAAWSISSTPHFMAGGASQPALVYQVHVKQGAPVKLPSSFRGAHVVLFLVQSRQITLFPVGFSSMLHWTTNVGLLAEAKKSFEASHSAYIVPKRLLLNFGRRWSGMSCSYAPFESSQSYMKPAGSSRCNIQTKTAWPPTEFPFSDLSQIQDPNSK